MPLAAVLTAATVHDQWTLAETLDSTEMRASRLPRGPAHPWLDKGYCFSDCEAVARARHIVPHIRRKGEQPLVGRVHGKPTRSVVERTGSWCSPFRALLVRSEVKAANYLGLFHLACALIVLQHS
jgi:hypothetical protein